MNRLLTRAAPIALALLMTGCGYIGDPLPPSLHIPLRVTDLSVVERGARLEFHFTVPAQTTDGVGLKVGEVELRVGPAEGEWANQGRRVAVAAAEPGPAEASTSVEGLTGQDLIAGVRVSSRAGRSSEWSNQVRFRAVPPLDAPREVRAVAVPTGVRITWAQPDTRPGMSWRILRRTADQKQAEPLATSEAPEFTDTTTQYEKPYEYSIQAALTSGGAAAESAVSPSAAVTPEDHFPPAVPANLSGAAGVNNIQLSWDPDTEPDLRGYYLYRSVDGGPFERPGGIMEEPAWTDRNVEPGKHYRYAVSAVDQRGNESARSSPVEIIAQ